MLELPITIRDPLPDEFSYRQDVYLALPPGWRFLVTENYEDVWQALSFLQINSDSTEIQIQKLI